jgi:hypothetical protein
LSTTNTTWMQTQQRNMFRHASNYYYIICTVQCETDRVPALLLFYILWIRTCWDLLLGDTWSNDHVLFGLIPKRLQYVFRLQEVFLSYCHWQVDYKFHSSFNYLKHSVYYIHTNTHTLQFNDSAFCPQGVWMGFVSFC